MLTMKRLLSVSICLLRAVTPSRDDLYSLWLFCLMAFERTVASGLIVAGILYGTVYFVVPVRSSLAHLLTVSDPMILGVEVLVFSFQITVIALVVCLLAGACARLLYFTRLVYRLVGWVGKGIFFGIPCLRLTAWMSQQWFPQLNPMEGCTLGIIPTAFLLPVCIDYTERSMPELLPLLTGLCSALHINSAFGTKAASTNSEQSCGRGCKDSRMGSDCGEQHHLEVLGLDASFTLFDLRTRYHELAQQYHPDKVQNLGPKLRITAEQEMKRINEAYHYLNRQLPAN